MNIHDQIRATNTRLETLIAPYGATLTDLLTAEVTAVEEARSKPGFRIVVRRAVATKALNVALDPSIPKVKKKEALKLYLTLNNLVQKRDRLRLKRESMYFLPKRNVNPESYRLDTACERLGVKPSQLLSLAAQIAEVEKLPPWTDSEEARIGFAGLCRRAAKSLNDSLSEAEVSEIGEAGGNFALASMQGKTKACTLFPASMPTCSKSLLAILESSLVARDGEGRLCLEDVANELEAAGIRLKPMTPAAWLDGPGFDFIRVAKSGNVEQAPTDTPVIIKDLKHFAVPNLAFSYAALCDAV